MRCEENVERIARMLEGALPDEERRELGAHISTCGRCKAEVLLQRKIDGALASVKPALLPTDFTAQVAARTTARSAMRRGAPRWVPLASAASVIAALAAVVGAAVPVIRSGDRVGGTLAGEIVRPLASAAAAVLDTLRSLAPAWDAPSPLGPIPPDWVHVLPWILLSGIALFWGLGKALSFLRE